MEIEMLNQSKMMNHSQLMSIGQQMPVASQVQQVILMNNMNNQNYQMMNQSQSQVRLNRRCGGYGMWPPQQVNQFMLEIQSTKPSGYLPSSNPRNNNNRKVKRGIDKRNHNNWKEVATLKESQQQNRVKPKRYISKKKFNHGGKSAPFAPRNTTSFLIRAKKAGGITSLVSPSPVTPAILPTPIFSPSNEVLIDTAKEEWGVDGYGSMKGLIRLRSPGKDEDGSSESDVEVERKLDHDLSRFEMICPNNGVFDLNNSNNNSCLLENRVDDQDTHIAQLEEKNMVLKNRLFIMEKEFDNLRTRLQCLEMQNQGSKGLFEEILENKNSVDDKIEDDDDDDHVNAKAANVESCVNQ